MKKYTIRCKNPSTEAYHTKEVDGIPVKIVDGYEFFTHETVTTNGGEANESWTVSEVSTGRAVCSAVTKEMAIARAKENVLGAGERFVGIIERMLKENEKLFKQES